MKKFEHVKNFLISIHQAINLLYKIVKFTEVLEKFFPRRKEMLIEEEIP